MVYFQNWRSYYPLEFFFNKKIKIKLDEMRYLSRFKYEKDKNFSSLLVCFQNWQNYEPFEVFFFFFKFIYYKIKILA